MAETNVEVFAELGVRRRTKGKRNRISPKSRCTPFLERLSDADRFFFGSFSFHISTKDAPACAFAVGCGENPRPDRKAITDQTLYFVNRSRGRF